METGSKIFTSYRGLGLVSNEIPLVTRYIKRRRENLIITVIGNAFHTYGSKNLRLISVGNSHTEPIASLTADTYHVYTASKKTIYAWRRTTELIKSYSDHVDDVALIMPFGPHLLALDKQNILYVWNIKAGEKYLQMEFSSSFQISCMMHPATYINKILLGSKQGKLQLWNLNTNKLIYTFSGWDSQVTVLEQAPAKDVVAIGLSSGEIYVHNLKVDETVMNFKQEWGPVTSISFRTDGIPVMVSGSMLGHIAIWNLQERRLSSQIWAAHKSAVTGMQCLPNEPKMTTSSPDNTLKMWIFDLPDGGARLLNIQEGHSAPPLMARFHGSLGDNIIAAGEDSTVRIFSTVTDMLNKSLGEASYDRKVTKTKKHKRNALRMPPIVCFTSETTQEKPWDNIACIHMNKCVVTTWSFHDQRMGDHKLKHDRFDTPQLRNAIATSLALSVCGNYVVICYNSGHMDKFNIQSGLYRGTFADPNLAHETCITTVVADGLNQLVVSGDQSGVLKWWKFKSFQKLHQFAFSVGISAMILHRDSGLLGIYLEDWSLQVADIDTRKVVRHFNGHTNQITDVVFSPKSNWILSASLDRTIRTWDLPSSSCVDMFCVPVAASSISLSPTGDYLATIHAGHLGVYLWANRTCFQHVSLNALPVDFVAPLVPLPSVGVDGSRMVIEQGREVIEEVEEDMDLVEEYESPEQIAENLITLSLIPTSRWLNLLHIDTIKQRNKPIEPPKAPKAAPFFIPIVPRLDLTPAEPSSVDLKMKHENENKSKLNAVMTFECLTAFGEKLKEKKFEKAVSILIDMGPAAIDAEIRGLDPDTGGSQEVLVQFLRMIEKCLRKRKYFEATEGYLGLFLKVHADYMMQNEETQELCQKLYNSHKDSWHSVKDTINESLSLISYFKNAAVINY